MEDWFPFKFFKSSALSISRPAAFPDLRFFNIFSTSMKLIGQFKESHIGESAKSLREGIG